MQRNRSSKTERRFVIYGAGGVGGTIGARLHIAGYAVCLIARGAHYRQIKNSGLRFASPAGSTVLDIPCAEHPRDAGIGPEDAVLLCVKGQHTEAVLRDLHDAAGGDARVICAQNGVENERMALRRFARTYGMAVWLPAEHLEPGVVVNFAENRAGRLDVGCYPAGADAFIEDVSAALADAGFASRSDADIMAHKYEKLLSNLGNAMDAATGRSVPAISTLLREEALACYAAAGIRRAELPDMLSQRSTIRGAEVAGHPRHGGSSMQSLLRGTGDIETDFLNGEIVLLGRLHGIPVPANAAMQEIGARLVRDKCAPGSMTVEQVEQLLGIA